MISISENLNSYKLKKQQSHNYESQLMELIEQLGDLSSNNPLGWTAADSTLVGGKYDKEYNTQSYLKLRGQAFNAYRINPYARSIINNLVNLTVGTGAQIIFHESNSAGDLKQLTDFWELWTHTVRWRRKQREIVKRAYRDGETFIHLSDFNDISLRGLTKLSFFEPDWVRSNDTKITHGIETDLLDVEEVISYRLILPNNISSADDIVIPEIEVVHIKENADGNIKRGRSELECVLPWIEHKIQNLQARTLLNKFRTNIVAVRKLPGAKDALRELRTRLKATSTTTTTTGGSKEKMPPMGSVVTMDSEGGADLEFKSPNVGASDAKEDDRMINLFITAGVQLPEFVVTGDASNANFASTRQALLTGRKRIEEEQLFFGEEFCEIFRRVVIEAKRFGLLRESVSDRCTFNFPLFDMNDFKEQTDAFASLISNGIVSKGTMASRLGFDFEKELKLMDKEFENEFDDLTDKRDKKDDEEEEENENEEDKTNDEE